MNQSAPASCTVNYVIFNENWDRVVGNTVSQSGAPLTRYGDVGLYLEYLYCSIRSLLRQGLPRGLSIHVWIVQLVDLDFSDVVEAYLSLLGEGLPLTLHTVAHAQVRPFVEKAQGIPASAYRSPNRLHEYLLLGHISRDDAARAVVVDNHVLFLEPDVLGKTFHHMEEHGALLGSFVEEPHWRNGRLVSGTGRRRLHTFLLLARPRALVAAVNPRFLTYCDEPMEPMALVSDKACVAYYRDRGVFDTLSPLSEYFRHNHPDPNAVLNLNTFFSASRDQGHLELFTRQAVHSRYLDPRHAPVLLRFLTDAAGLSPHEARELITPPS